MGIEKSKIEFSLHAPPESKKEVSSKFCVICWRPIWHTDRKGPYANVCGRACGLSRVILGGGRGPEETWKLMDQNKLSDWSSMEEFWRDMGWQYFPGAFLVRKNRGAKHSKENSRWVGFAEASAVKNELVNSEKAKRILPNGVVLGDIVKAYGIHIALFQRMCGGIARRFNLTLDMVYQEFGSAPPPMPNWREAITVQHQGQEYSIDRISKEAGISTLALYWRWMKGMYLIDDSIHHRLIRIRSRDDARAKQKKRFGDFQKWDG